MVFHWSLSDSKSHKVSRTLLGILAGLTAIVRMVSTRSLISKSCSPFTNPLEIVSSAQITIGITIIFRFSIFFSSLARSKYLSLFRFLLFSVCGLLGWQNPLFGWFSVFCWHITMPGCLAEIRWSVRISKSQRILCHSFSRTDSGLCIYHLFVWSKLDYLHNSQWITFPTQSSLVLYLLSLSLSFYFL